MSERQRVKAPPLSPDLDQRIIWTAKAIGARIGVGADFVRDTIAREPDSPIKALGSRLYVFENDLFDWLRHRAPIKPTKTD